MNNLMKKVIYVLPLLYLAGCASESVVETQDVPVQQVQPSLPIVTVDAAQLAEFWVIDDAPSVLEDTPKGMSIAYGCVAVNFGIDRDGQMFDVRVMKSYPQGKYTDFAKSVLTEYEFESAEMNAAQQPVRTTWTLGLVDVDGKLSLHKAEHMLRYCQ